VVKEKYGSREKLLEQLATSTGRAKDKDYKTRLEGYTTPRLVDAVKVAERRAKGASSKGRATGEKSAKSAAPKKSAKKPAAKSAGAKSGKSSSKTAG
jgi:hypothetical protein